MHNVCHVFGCGFAVVNTFNISAIVRIAYNVRIIAQSILLLPYYYYFTDIYLCTIFFKYIILYFVTWITKLIMLQLHPSLASYLHNFSTHHVHKANFDMSISGSEFRYYKVLHAKNKQRHIIAFSQTHG